MHNHNQNHSLVSSKSDKYGCCDVATSHQQLAEKPDALHARCGPRQRRQGHLERLQPPPAALRRHRGAHARAPQARIDARGDVRYIQPHRYAAVLPQAAGRAGARPRSCKTCFPSQEPLPPHHTHDDGCLKARRPSPHARGTRVAFHAHAPSPSPPAAKRKSASVAEARGGGGSRSGDAGRKGSGGPGGEKRNASCRSHAASPAPPGEADKAWSARRRALGSMARISTLRR